MNRPGISAILMADDAGESAVLDLVAVLDGLGSANFEIIIVSESRSAPLAAPPLRTVSGATLAAGCEKANYDTIFVAAKDGEFDLRQLNKLMEAVERGADAAVGYRARRTDRITRHVQRLGVPVELDFAFGLFPRCACNDLSGGVNPLAALVASTRRRGYRIAEVRVRRRDARIGVSAAPRAITRASPTR